ncbi:MAG TPA: 3-deoxy-7-phosphoheptulonate synthase [Acidimicrobiales bacterium]|jgi:3-deoxy-7-phosphoheptulonate synthase|nr:3-deoxy-7-phosphoheptulonate synthase [Acidimicrobiales bacterium]
MTPETTLQNQRITGVRPLVSPRQLRDELPLSQTQADVVRHGRDTVTAILNGSDDRLLVVVGPCSLHDPVAGLDYARRLHELAGQVSDEVFVVMRAYFEKPRTTVGWKGLINDPALDGTFHVNEGLAMARHFLLDVLSIGLPVGCEFLDPITAEFLADAVSWGAIGARTSASQIHRQMASGLSMPVGFKNSPEGDVQIAVDAVMAATTPQVFPGIDPEGRAAIFTTAGNAESHVVLRGSAAGPNYHAADVADVVQRLDRAKLSGRVIVDASHANSGKDHRHQPGIAADVGQRWAAGEPGLRGLMLESFLVEGQQAFTPGKAPTSTLTYGQSITDACIGWDTTVEVLHTLARQRAGATTPATPATPASL